MAKISQNKRVAISAVALFIVSFSIMLFFLGDKTGNLWKDSVLHGGEREGASFNYLSIDSIYKAYLASFDEPIFVTNKGGKFEYANDLYEEKFESNFSDLRGKKFLDFVNTEDISELAQVYTKVIQSGKSISATGPFRMISGEEERLVLLTAIPLINSESMVEKIIFVVKDLTDQVEELNGDVKGQKQEVESWVNKLYPKIKEIEKGETKLLVDKISYVTR